jgi:hypothetical protein
MNCIKMIKRLERLKNTVTGRLTTYQSERKLVVSRRPGLHYTLVQSCGNRWWLNGKGNILAFPANRLLYTDYRAGISVDLKPRTVTCHAIRCIDFSPPTFTLEVHCGGGFYVRSLVHDLGNGKYSNNNDKSVALVRDRTGPWSAQQPYHVSGMFQVHA